MSFDIPFDTTFDFSINEETISSQINQFQKMVIECDTEKLELEELSLYVDITSEKITELENNCKSYRRRIKEYENLQNKLNELQALNSSDKLTLYEMYIVLQNGKNKFISVAIDRYRKLIDTAKPILDDTNISVSGKEQLFKIIFEKEEREQRKSDERHTNLLRDPM